MGFGDIGDALQSAVKNPVDFGLGNIQRGLLGRTIPDILAGRGGDGAPTPGIAEQTQGTKDIASAIQNRSQLSPEELSKEGLAGVSANTGLVQNGAKGESSLGMGPVSDAITGRANRLSNSNFENLKSQTNLQSTQEQGNNLNHAFMAQMAMQKVHTEAMQKLMQAQINAEAARSGALKQIFSIGGTVAGAMIGGPVGAGIGGQAGGAMAGPQTQVQPLQSSGNTAYGHMEQNNFG